MEEVVGLRVGLAGEVGPVPPADRELSRRVAEEAAHEGAPPRQAEELQAREATADGEIALPSLGSEGRGDGRRGAAVLVADREMEEEIAEGGAAGGGQGALARRADAGQARGRGVEV